MKQFTLQNTKRQSGMTLVIGLIMLTVLTTIAVTVANMSTVELKITSNQQAAQQARAAAESGIDFLVANPTILTKYAPFSPVNADPTLDRLVVTEAVADTNEDWSTDIVVQRMGDPLPCPATSGVNASSSNASKCVYFEIESTGTFGNEKMSTAQSKNLCTFQP